MADVLGVPRDMQSTFRHWTTVIINIQNYAFSGNPPPEAMAAEAKQAISDLREFVLAEMAAVRKQPREDLISNLVNLSDSSDDPLSDLELLSILTTFLFGGAETTYKLIGTLFYHLMKNPASLAEIRQDRSLIDAAIEETLRYDGPALLLQRQTTKDMNYYGETIPADSPVLLGTAAANRDPRKWGDDSEHFNIHRDTRGHMGFGMGLHFCIGAPLARMETRHALEAAIDRFSSMKINDQGFKRDSSYYLRGIASMKVAVTRG